MEFLQMAIGFDGSDPIIRICKKFGFGEKAELLTRQVIEPPIPSRIARDPVALRSEARRPAAKAPPSRRPSAAAICT